MSLNMTKIGSIMAGYDDGYLPTPSISSITPVSFLDSTTGIVVVGANFGTNTGTAKIELGSTSNYSTATKVTQTVTAWSSTSITITSNQGALINGQAFMFVTNSQSRTSPGTSCTLSVQGQGSSPKPPTVTPWVFPASQAGIIITGIGFGANTGSANVELGSTSNYSTATKVAQTVTAWTDTKITFTSVNGALGLGKLYLFVTLSDGSRLAVTDIDVDGTGYDTMAVFVSTGTVTTLNPSDSAATQYGIIEAAQPGDAILIPGGIYHYRIYVRNLGTSSAPIAIQAADPNNRPLFDYTGAIITTWPGSYSGGDAYRSGWRCDGSHYIIDGLKIQGASDLPNNENTAGLRLVNPSHIRVRNSYFYNNNMGTQGGGTDIRFDYCEFDNNGVSGTDQSHNIYMLGGDRQVFNGCYSHDCKSGQSMHTRGRVVVVQYCWLEKSGDYEFDMMTDTTTYDASFDHTQTLYFMGNIVIQNPNPNNQYKLLTLHNDVGTAGMIYTIYCYWNTFVLSDPNFSGANGGGVIQINNQTVQSVTATISNNILVSGTTQRHAYLLGASGTANYTISGAHNFMLTSSDPGVLTNTVFASDALYTSPSTKDYSLQSGSAARNIANTGLTPAPTYEATAPITSVSLRASLSDAGAINH